MALLSECVVGMYLYRQVVVGIDDFHKQRKLFSVFPDTVTAKKPVCILLTQFNECQPFVLAVGDN